MSKTYITFVYGAVCIVTAPSPVRAQMTTAVDTSQSSCAAVLANDSTVGTRIGLGDSASRAIDTTSRPRPDTASFGVGGARSGPADVRLLVGIHADEVRFARQPHLRVRLCWGGDTLRVVQRDNLPSPIVPGTTYRNVYIAVELIGRINAECLADKIGVGGSSSQTPQPTNAAAASTAGTSTSVSSCAFLGGGAGTGSQSARPPTR
ncbi:MAG TPA: hypothetical protein VK544_01125 [Gemmatimonadaceae bacterium]|nr:hypothetical protein [Gemmatimonadaceae bacterium]